MYTLQLVERVLEAAGGINRLAAAGIDTHYHVVQLLVSDGMLVGCDRHFRTVTAGGGEGDHLRHKAAVCTSIVHHAAVTELAAFHQKGGQRFLNRSTRRLQRQHFRMDNIIFTPRNIISGDGDGA